MSILQSGGKVLHTKTLQVVGVLVIALFGVLVSRPTFAIQWVQDVFGPIILYVIFWPFIVLLNLLTYALLEVAQYNSFAEASIVNIGWPVMRDISNMFFVFILLIIAIGTIVKWQVINYRQNLRRLVIMALLINFSKTIVVFFIDISQIFTLTFISEVKKVLQVGIIVALGLNKIANPVTEGAGADIVQGGIGLFTYVIAGIFVAVACLVVLCMVLIFLVRIIALWMLIVFSPAAFLASALPQTKQWYDKWWQILSSNVVVAPVLAFMLWLTFAVIAGEGGSGTFDPIIKDQAAASASVEGAGGITVGNIISFATAIGVLIYSIRLAVQMGAAGGSFAAKIQGKAGGAVKWMGNRVAYGKSGQGGVAGRAKSAALGAVSGVATAGSLLRVPFAGRIAASATIARNKAMEQREKAETGERRYMTRTQRREQEQRTIGPRRVADRLQASDSQIVRRMGTALRTASTPMQKAAAREAAARANERDVNGNLVLSRDQVRSYRDAYTRTATDEELDEWDIQSNFAGLNQNNPNDAARIAELAARMAQNNKITGLMAANQTVPVAQAMTRFSNAKQIATAAEDLNPEEKARFTQAIVEAFEQGAERLVEIEGRRGGRDNDEYRNADDRQSELRRGVMTINAQTALDHAGPAATNLVANFNDLVSRMKQESYNHITTNWLQNPANRDQILGLTGMNIRRLLVSDTLAGSKKDDLLRIVIEARDAGDARGARLVGDIQASNVTNTLINDYQQRNPAPPPAPGPAAPAPGGPAAPAGGGAPAPGGRPAPGGGAPAGAP